MTFFDAHCDTLYEVTFNNHKFRENELHIDANRLRNSGKYSQIFAAWIENADNARQKFCKMADKFDEVMEKNKDIIKKCTSYNDLVIAHSENKTAAFFSLEGAYQINKTEDIDYIFKRGIRFVNFTWNSSNSLAGGVSSKGGITELGRNVLKKMENIGIIIDVSHLNEQSFWDVAGLASKPIIASHSNSKTLCNHERNLTDTQFKKIAETGGCVGINFYSAFLSCNDKTDVDDVIRHIRHFINIGGEDHIGLGSDFDGVDKLPSGINGVQSMEYLGNIIEKNFGGNCSDKILHGNFERIIKEIKAE